MHSLHSVGQIVPKAGDYVTIYDEPMGLYGVPGLITNIKRVLDNPQSNSITVDTSYTDDEELVGNIITATNTVLSNKDIYARTAILKSDGTISGAAMAKTLEESVGKNITFIGVSGSTLLDSNGLLATNPNNPERKIKYTGAGVFGTVDNGITYDAMMTPEGINANYINSGSIDTRKLQIISGLYSKVVLDNFGLSVKDDPSSRYTLPIETKEIEGERFLDWSQSNLRAFIGVDAKNDAQLYLKGQMQIDGGSTIAGWNVVNDRLSSGSGSNYVALSSGNDYALWAGAQDPKDATIVIKKNGTGIFKGDIYANSLTLSDAVDIPESNIDSLGSYFKRGREFTVGTISNGQNTIGFKVSNAGLLQANNAIIYGTIYAKSGEFAGELKAATGSFGGTVTATAGVIGGCNITNGTLYVTNANISGRISTNHLDSSVITTGNLSAQSISANQITAGTLDASKITVSNLNADNIKSGTLSSAGISVPGLKVATSLSLSFSYYTTSGKQSTSIVSNPWVSGGTTYTLLDGQYLLTQAGSTKWQGRTQSVPINVAGVVTKTLYFKNGIFVGCEE